MPYIAFTIIVLAFIVSATYLIIHNYLVLGFLMILGALGCSIKGDSKDESDRQ